MNRTEGLVQRRTAVASKDQSGGPSNSNSNNHSGQASAKNVASFDGDSGSNDCAGGYYENDADSKETRLTLMEEVLLLGLKDKEV